MIPTITVDEIAADSVLLDVREPDEFAAGHAPGARHLPMREVPARLAEVPEGRDLVVVCRSGVRSAHVVGFLLGNGWRRVRNLGGGMHDWVAAGRPLVSDTGDPPHVL
jgi:rhodanese-related sulfurtransferase